MRQTLFAIVAAALFVGSLTVVITLRNGGPVQAQQVLPTPKGQLGGAVRLTPLPASVETPIPTPPTGTPAANGSPVASRLPMIGCNIAPRSLDDIRIIIGAATPTMSITHETGEPADPAIVDDVTRTVGELVACLNAGDQLRTAALLTDGAVRQSFSQTGWSVDQAPAVLVPLPPRAAAQQIRVQAIIDVRQLVDGRVSATVVLIDPSRFPLDAVTTQHLLFAKTGDRWLIDAIDAAGS